MRKLDKSKNEIKVINSYNVTKKQMDLLVLNQKTQNEQNKNVTRDNFRFLVYSTPRHPLPKPKKIKKNVEEVPISTDGDFFDDDIMEFPE